MALAAMQRKANVSSVVAVPMFIRPKNKTSDK